MSSLSVWRARSAALLVLGLSAGAAAPIVVLAPAMAANFVDVQGHWARPFIETLAAENIISGYSDRTFRPDQSVTRAQFTAMISQAFDENNVQLSQEFDRVAADYWVSREFSNGRLSNRQIRPSDPLSRVQVLVALANGLGLNSSDSVANALNVYRDASTIPEVARGMVAAATQKGIVVNYPDITTLNPSKTATRADVAAFIYQALVNEGILAPISSRVQVSKYIVQVTPGNNQATNTPSGNQTVSNNRNTQTAEYKVAKGTSINVQYEMSDKVRLAPGETLRMTLKVAEDIKNAQGGILIPRGSEIEGQLVPRYSGSQFLGTQFVAQRLSIGNQSYNNINVTSSLVTTVPPKTNNPSTLGDAAINILSGVLTGGRSPNTNTQQEQLIVIDPEVDLPLKFGSDFYVNNVTNAQTP